MTVEYEVKKQVIHRKYPKQSPEDIERGKQFWRGFPPKTPIRKNELTRERLIRERYVPPNIKYGLPIPSNAFVLNITEYWGRA